MKPILCWQKDEEDKIKMQGRIMEGLKELKINNESVKENVTQICMLLKSKGEYKPLRLVKRAKVPTWSKEIMLETYLKQIKYGI